MSRAGRSTPRAASHVGTRSANGAVLDAPAQLAAPQLSGASRGPILVTRSMKLSQLLEGIELKRPLVDADREIVAPCYDSRRAAPGAAFFAIRGEVTDGNRFVAAAVERGAAAVVSETARPATLGSNVAWVEVADARKSLALAAANFYGHPADALQLAGVTGTNGKTTTAYLLDSILRAAGRTSGLFGTIAHRTPLATVAATTTTPESLDLQKFLSEIVRAGGTHAVLEASSHALAMDRLWGCGFAVAVFTNLTRDHLDYHKSFEAYFAAKRRLFEGTGRGPAHVGVINGDDPYGERLEGLATRTLRYGLRSGEITTRKFSLTAAGLDFEAETPAGSIVVRSHLVGRTNVYNILAAIGAGVGLEIAPDAIAAGIARLESVPGRFERVVAGQPFMVVVDYAHTDDALTNLLATSRELLSGGGRILTLFGCGGDRDRAKRPMMGEAAGRASDFVVLTSDNPRSEDPLRIINDALVGLQRTEAEYRVEPDRERAIGLALEQARAGDIVLLAGKGHENYQVLSDRTIEFDDREVARRWLARSGYAV
ncbi:MAG: UDP-N-acetylmuramoyl-L-alanyl-D-glutamate--2,6-diaminopimelate ligase [Candidatus Acidiferrales bacterium]